MDRSTAENDVIKLPSTGESRRAEGLIPSLLNDNADLRLRYSRVISRAGPRIATERGLESAVLSWRHAKETSCNAARGGNVCSGADSGLDARRSSHLPLPPPREPRRRSSRFSPPPTSTGCAGCIGRLAVMHVAEPRRWRGANLSSV